MGQRLEFPLGSGCVGGASVLPCAHATSVSVRTGLAVLPTKESELSKSCSRDYQGKKVRHLADGGIEITKRLGPKKKAKTVHRPIQPSSGGAGCFPAQTRVLTPSGLQNPYNPHEC